MREIIFDTETTGLDPKAGDRLIEIGGVELVNRFPTGRHYHQYINPEREVSQGAYEVHGFSWDDLKDNPTFAEIAQEFLDFIGDDGILVAHNAKFDMGFINHQLDLVGLPIFSDDRVVDTLALARQKNPAGQNSLDALCARYGIDNTHRTLHGALLDSELLADVYIELLGGRQADLGLTQTRQAGPAQTSTTMANVKPRAKPLPTRLSDKDRAAHAAFIADMSNDAVWTDYTELSAAETSK